MSEELCILNGGVQTVAPLLAASQVVYLDFDGAATSYANAALGVAIDNVTVEDSGISESDIAVIVDALNGMFDDVVFTSALPADGEFSTIYVGVTSAFDEYGTFLGLAETIDSGNTIHDDNAFVLLDSSTSTELVVSVIAHETEHIVHGMDHGGEGLRRFAEDYNVGSGQVSSGVILNENDAMHVSSGGTATSTTVNYGGEMNVFSSGTATNTTVIGGQQHVSQGGMAITTTVSADGEQNVSNGGTVTGTTINRDGTQLVSGGTVTCTLVEKDAKQFVYGGTVTDTTINRGGTQLVSGGTITCTHVEKDATQFVYGGTLISTTLEGNGACQKLSGCTAVDTIINAENAHQIISADATANNTIISVGDQLITTNGTAIDTILRGGSQVVDNGGTATGTTISGGTQIVNSGGTAMGTTNIGGTQNLYGGTADSTTICDGGVMHVSNGGTADSTTICDGGVMEVFSGGTVGGLSIADGAVVSAHDGGVIEFDLQGVSPNNAPFVHGMSLIEGKPSMIVKVASFNKHGDYYLADGAEGFDMPIIINGGTSKLGPDDVILSGTVCYTLSEDSGKLKFGLLQKQTVASAISATYNVSLGSCLCSATVLSRFRQAAPQLSVLSGGMTFSTSINSNCTMNVQRGASAHTTTVRSGGSMIVNGARIVSTTVLNNGNINLYDGTAKATTVTSGGRMFVSNVKLTGTLTIADGGTVTAANGSTIDFDISALTPGNAPIVNNLSLIKGNPSYAVTVKAKQALGDYSLAGGAANFNGTLTVKCAGAEDITLTVGDARVPIGDKGYSLAVMDGKLLLSIIDITPPAAPELTLSGDSASRELIVTAAWDTDDAVCLYAVDGSEELTEYDSPLLFSDDASVRFQTKDAADNTTDRSLDLMFGRATGKWTEGYRAWNPDGYDKTVELKSRNVIGGVFDGSDDSTILVLTDDDNGDALFMDDIYSAYPNGKAAQSRISKVNEIIAGAGDDIVDLTSPRFDYADGGVTVHGGLGDDVIWANSGSNRLFGDEGNDRIVGGDGNDVIVGGAGNDVMHGGGGDDIFCFCGGWGNDAVEQLATGKVTLWFADGDESKWDAETLTYTDGENSVTVTGVADVTLLFGNADERYDGLLAAGAFDAFTSERIFENKDAAILIVA